MKKTVLLGIVFVLTASGVLAGREEELGVSLDLSYWSKWMSKGFEVYGQQGALFKTVDLDLYDTGFGLKVTHRNATGSGYVNKQRIDYRPYYKGLLFEDETYATNYNISAGYEHYPGLARNRSYTTWEWILALSWPDLMPEQGLTSIYIAHFEYAAGEDYTKTPAGGDIPSGWVHRFILGYDLDMPETPLPLYCSAEVAYSDGLAGAEHDWSYATFGLSTKMDIAENLFFVPAVYQQVTMEKSVNSKKDITYCVLSMKYKF
jgi:hypothetical protein